MRVASGVGYSVGAGLGSGNRRTGLRYSSRPGGESRFELRLEYDLGRSRRRADPEVREAKALGQLAERLDEIDARGPVDLRAAEDAVSAVTEAAIDLDNARPGAVPEARWADLARLAGDSATLRAVTTDPRLSSALGFETPDELVNALRDRRTAGNRAEGHY